MPDRFLSIDQVGAFRRSIHRLIKSKKHTVSSIARLCRLHRATLYRWLGLQTMISSKRASECLGALGLPGLESDIRVHRRKRVPSGLRSLLTERIEAVNTARLAGVGPRQRSNRFVNVGHTVSDICVTSGLPHRLVVDHIHTPDTALEVWFDLPNFLPTVWCMLLIDGPEGLRYDVITPDLEGSPRRSSGHLTCAALLDEIKIILATSDSHRKVQHDATTHTLGKNLQRELIRRAG